MKPRYMLVSSTRNGHYFRDLNNCWGQLGFFVGRREWAKMCAGRWPW